jgi:hypothetical protein
MRVCIGITKGKMERHKHVGLLIRSKESSTGWALKHFSPEYVETDDNGVYGHQRLDFNETEVMLHEAYSDYAKELIGDREEKRVVFTINSAGQGELELLNPVNKIK